MSEVLFALLSRMLAPLARWLVRRDPKCWVVIGREHGKYLDNAKHFHAWLHVNPQLDCDVVFVSEHPAVIDALANAGAAALLYPRPRAIAAILRAGTIVFDSADVIEHGRIGLLQGARRVQLWHGVPLKEIELPLHMRRLGALCQPWRSMVMLQKWILGRYAPCDVLVSTSDFFTEHAFQQCLPAKQISAVGYPRNDALKSGLGASPLLQINVDEVALGRLRAHRRNGGRVALYAPTFRHKPNSPFEEGWLDLPRLSSFATANHVLVALKLHPSMADRDPAESLPGIVDIASASDVYPLLPEVDALVTDYSSIYFDYLLLDRPVLFYAYDYDTYVSTDRQLLFDYLTMTPGPKCNDFEALLTALTETLVAGKDEHSADRSRVLGLAFAHTDAKASQRLWQWLARPTEAA